jgi:glycerol-3-phosphate dehydrogenase
MTDRTTSSSSVAGSTAAASRAMRRVGACRSAWPSMGDLAGATSSASTKLFHGGLAVSGVFRVPPCARGADRTRDAPARHAAYQLADALRPALSPDMRFDSETPTSRLLIVMPWMKGRRPAWLIRWACSSMTTWAGARSCRARTRVAGPGTPEGAPLQDKFATRLRVFRLLGGGFAPRRSERPRCRGARRRDPDAHPRAVVPRATGTCGA